MEYLNTITKQQLKTNEFNSYYAKYINLVANDKELIIGLENDEEETVNYFNSISINKLEYRYQPEKWTIKEVFQHLIDTERVFSYRCFVIGRGDKTNLPSFDQNTYILPSKANSKSIEVLTNEFIATRNITLSILKSFTNNDLEQLGNVNNTKLSPRACGFIILGHRIWHTNIINERYFN